MNIQEQINTFITSLPEPKQSDILGIQQIIFNILPDARIWFDAGKDAENKVVSNPTIGYGSFIIRYANGTSREFFQIGISPNASGISVYLLGLNDKEYLARTFGGRIGKASVSKYCIKFKSLSGINTDILEEAIRYGISASALAPENP